MLATIRGSMGEPPARLRATLESRWKISAYDADVLVNQGHDLVAYFEELATAVGDGKLASNWMQQDVLRILNETGVSIDGFPVRPAGLADLISRVSKGDFDTSRGREILATMVAERRPERRRSKARMRAMSSPKSNGLIR